MKKLVALILCSLALATGRVRADYLWTWHGDSDLFQGSFRVTDREMLPNSTFNSSVFSNSLVFSSLDGVQYFATNTQTFLGGAGFGPPLNLSMRFADPQTLAYLSVVSVPNQGSHISETSTLPFGNNGENGYWTYAQVPEPSIAALAGIGVLFAAKRGCAI